MNAQEQADSAIFMKLLIKRWVARVDGDDDTIIVELAEGWFFRDQPDAHEREFATLRQADRGTYKHQIFFRDI